MGDRAARGSLIGAGLGVCLGIASQVVSDGKKLTPEERTEVMLDLHGLHATEATEVVEEFLLAVRRLASMRGVREIFRADDAWWARF